MNATLGTTPHSNWQELAPLLQALGCDAKEPETWYKHHESLPDGYFILVYTQPQLALMHAMEQGQEPEKALQEWEEGANALIALYKKNRRRAVLINSHTAGSNLEGLAAALSSHWNIEIPLAKTGDSGSERPVDPYLQLIATFAVQQSRQLTGLLAQLEACTLPVNSEEAAPKSELDINALYHRISELYQEKDRYEALTKQYEALEKENQQITQQLHKAQEELETSLNNHINEQKASDKLRAEIETLKVAQAAAEQAKTKLNEDLKILRTSIKAAETQSQKHRDEATRLQQELERARQQSQEQTSAFEAENQLVIEQLHLVQEELESTLQAHKNEEKATEKLSAEIDALKTTQTKADAEKKQRAEELNKLSASLKTAESQYQKSRSEATRLQQELEQARQQSQEQKSALEAENQLIIEQLHLVQEELERQLIHKQALENQVKELTQEQDHALAAANNQINRLQNELNRIKDSAAWKAVAPVRAMGRPFKRTPPEKRKLKKQAEQLQSTQYFDAAWYLKTYPDVAESKANPVEHYLKFGAQEGRNPCPEFDTQWYVQANPDVQESGINPLIHFLNHGQEEGRAPNPRVQNSLPSPQEAK